MTNNRKTPRLRWALAAVGATVALTGAAIVGRGLWADHEIAGREDEVRAHINGALAFAPDPSTTYAAVAESPSASAWSELLAAAGTPLPAVVPAADAKTPAGYRLLVLATSDAAAADALAAPGRAVIQIDVPEGTIPAGGVLRFADARVPLAGVPAHVLDMRPDERAIAGMESTTAGSSSTQTPLAAVRAVKGGVVVRMGVDLAALLMQLRQGAPVPEADVTDHDGNGSRQPADLLPRLPADATLRPFADEAMDALLNAIAAAWPACPLPRTRGLPAGDSHVVVISADQDYAPDDVIAWAADVLDDNHAQGTFLLTDPTVGARPDLNVNAHGSAPELSAPARTALLRAGHTIGVHPFLLEASDVTRVADRFARTVGRPPLVSRNHHLRWPGHVDVARAQDRAGIAVDLDFMAVCAGDTPCAMFPGGAAQPVRFIDARGARLSVWQQPTAVDDYSLRVEDPSRRSQAARALGETARRLLDAAAAAQAPLVINAHPYLLALERAWMDTLLAGPVTPLTVERWIDFVAQRRTAKISLSSCAQPQISLPPVVDLKRP